MENANGQQEPVVAEMSLLAKLSQIFTNPSKVFQHIDSYLDWLVPILIIIVFAIGRNLIMYDLEITATKEKIAQNEKIPDQQKTEILAKIDEEANDPAQTYKQIGYAIVFTFLFAFVVAGLYLLTGNVILGGKATYSKILGVYALGALVFIPEQIVKVPLALAKGSKYVYTSLAILFDQSQSQTLLFQLANAIDIFSIWRVSLWAIGFSVVYKFSLGKSYTAIVIWYVIGIFILYGLNLLTGGMLT